MTPFFAKPPITATIARGVPAATPHAPATTITDMVEMRFRVTTKVITAKTIVNSTSQGGEFVRYPLNRRLPALSFLNQPDDLAKDSLVSHFLGPHLEHARLVNRSSEHPTPNHLLNSDCFSCYCRLVDESRTFD